MKIKMQLFLFLLFCFYHLTQSANTTNSTYYYNQCAPTTCGSSILKWPFGLNQLCSGAYLTTSCEKNTVYLTDEESPSIKYQILQNLTNEVYSNRSVRLVDTSLFGCGPIPEFQGKTANSDYEAQKWIFFGSFPYNAGEFRTGTFLNCSKEPSHDTLIRMMKAPCLECGETSNLCYFYDGYIGHIESCRSFRVAIPAKQYGNFSGVGNLRRVLQQGFQVEWDGDCNICMERDVGRCGYVNQERKRGDEYCFCRDGIHRDNCTDGVIVELDAVGTSPPKKHGNKQIGVILVGIGMGAAVLLLGASYIFYKRRHNKKQTPFRRHDEQVLKRYDLGGDNGTSPASIETFLQNYTLGRPTRFSYKQLRKYTNNFSHKIGKGGFGSVYKGQLPNGFIFAVKILDESTNHIETQFLNEVLTIGRIHHNHLVRLLGYCFDESRIALLYEFMVNGSLDKYIHSKKTANNAPSKNTPSLE
ncbi:Rust resistance kinase lr10, partial [Thalictrum thalictroides]